MKRFYRHVQVASLTALLISTPIAFAAAADTSHQQHDQGAASVKLQLNKGKKWQTDEVLRQGMIRIKDAVAPNLSAIHQNTLDIQNYDTLSAKVSSEVTNIVENCHLEKKADAMLHLIIADMLAGAEAMLGKNEKVTRQDGAIQVVRSLEYYGQYFDHPNWQDLKG